MKSEDAPVTDDELVLRLVWRDFYKDGDPLKIKPRAFHPRDDETTGISVFRLACLVAPSDALRALPDPAKRTKYAIVAMSVAELKTLGITVTPDRNPSVPGHALLSELNSASWSTDKATWLPKVEKLAAASERCVMHKPGDGAEMKTSDPS